MFIPEKINLLYIEDDVDNAEIIFAYLEDTKHTAFNITHKTTLKEGLEFLDAECRIEETCEIDVVLLDLILPNSHGVATYKTVAAKCDFLPIVIISGHEEMACECIKLGAQDYLVKPDVNSGFIGRSLKYAIERSRLEKIASKNYERLKQSEEMFRNLVEIAGAGIYEIDLETGKFLYVNDVMCRQTGWTKEELMEMGPFGLLTDKSLNDWIGRWSAVEKTATYDGPFEYKIKKKDGGHIWGLVVAELTRDENDKITRANVVAIDISKQKLAEEVIKQKEDMIFSELEQRIHNWKEEILLKSSVEMKKLRVMDDKLISIISHNSEAL